MLLGKWSIWRQLLVSLTKSDKQSVTISIIFCFFPFNLIYFFHTHFWKFVLLSCKYFLKEVIIINAGYWRRRDLQIYLKTFGNQVLYALRFSQSVINLTQVFAAEISAFILLRLVFWKYDYCPWLLCPQ